MVERALLTALVALAVVGAAGAIASSFTSMVERLECGWSKAQVCILDGDVE